VELSGQVGPIHHPDALIHDLAILKEEEGRQGLNPIALGCLGLGLDVERGDRRLASTRLR
jgi:hypothetical protein